MTRVAKLLRRPKSTVSRWMSAMEEAGFRDRDGDSGRCRVSMCLAAVGEMAKHATLLQRTTRPALQRLTAATGETSNLAVLEGKEGINIEAVESPQPVMHMRPVGRRFPLHASAAGKPGCRRKPGQWTNGRPCGRSTGPAWNRWRRSARR